MAHPAAPSHFWNQQHSAVFVQTDNTAGNQVVAYHRSADGTLSLAKTYNTGGLGGVLTGAVVDSTASQGALTFDPRHSLLYAVNAGSNTVSVFQVHGDNLRLRQIIGSGGAFPASVTVHGDLVYVLNSEAGGSVQGFRVSDGYLQPTRGAARQLGLDPTQTPQFTHTPGQVAFTPDGSQLLVTTKANGNEIYVYGVRANGTLSGPYINSEPGAVPFAVTFDKAGNVAVAEAGINALATFKLSWTGKLTQLSSAGSGGAATCWVVSAGSTLFTSNTGSATLSGFKSAAAQLSLVGQTPTDPGTVDASATPHGHFLYVQTGKNGIVDEFAVHADGSLTQIGSVTVANSAGGEGIAVG